MSGCYTAMGWTNAIVLVVLIVAVYNAVVFMFRCIAEAQE